MQAGGALNTLPACSSSFRDFPFSLKRLFFRELDLSKRGRYSLVEGRPLPACLSLFQRSTGVPGGGAGTSPPGTGAFQWRFALGE